MAHRRSVTSGSSRRAARSLSPSNGKPRCAGWVFCHFPYWTPERWRQELELALSEVRRVARSGGTVFILETLGTAVSEPAAPSPALELYYETLQNQFGFRRGVLQTDYTFGSVDEAAALCDFFFGHACGDKVRAHNWARVPEFTGLWWRQY